jgi:hypothetical protein
MAKKQVTSVAVSTLVPRLGRFGFLLLSYNKMNQGSLEKGLILELEQRICKMRLEHFVMPNGKEVLKKFLQ